MMNRILISIISATLLLAVQMAFGQSDSEIDVMATYPELVVIEEVDTELGRVVIDGQEYEIYDGDTSLLGLPPEAAQRSISLDQLSAGMEVMVSTDGSVPTAEHRANIVAMWRPL